ncbi:hypothetical protein D3C85_1322500 [compost metagenome]
MLKRQTDIIQALQQELTTVLIQIKLNFKSIIICKLLVLKIDIQLVPIVLRCTLEQIFNLLFRQFDWQNAVFETVVVENVCIGRRDDYAESEILNRPRRVLTGGSATEVRSGNQNGSSLVTILVQRETLDYVACFVPSPFEEKELSET